MTEVIMNNNLNNLKEEVVHINGKKFIGRFEKLPMYKLFSAAHCQRRLDKDWVDEIADEYDDNLVGIITVSLRDGKYYVIDGQHRVSAIKRKFGANASVMCRVITGLTIKDEAWYFNKINKKRKRMNLNDDFNSDFYAEDPTVLGVINIGSKYGISFGNKNLTGMKNVKFRVKALDTSKHIYSKYGEEIFDRVCSILSQSFPEEQSAFNASLMDATAYITDTYGNACSDNMLIKRLRARNPDRLILDARNDRASGAASTSKKLARVIVRQVYNRRNPKPLDTSKVDF